MESPLQKLLFPENRSTEPQDYKARLYSRLFHPACFELLMAQRAAELPSRRKANGEHQELKVVAAALAFSLSSGTVRAVARSLIR